MTTLGQINTAFPEDDGDLRANSNGYGELRILTHWLISSVRLLDYYYLVQSNPV